MAGGTWLASACAAVLTLVSLSVGASFELKKVTVEPIRLSPSSRPVALVVGNTGYEHFVPRASGKNDAEAVAGLLARLRFEVVEAADFGRAEFVDRVADFHDRSRGSRAALFYYSGFAHRGSRFAKGDAFDVLFPVDVPARLDVGKASPSTGAANSVDVEDGGVAARITAESADLAEHLAALPAGEQFRDCADCPEMVVIPAGRFEMGCDTEDCDDDEKPAHEVQIRDDFALGRYEVTVGEFRRFAEAKGYRSDAEQDAGRGCWEVLMGRESGWTPGRSWRNLEYAAEDREPVTCVSWNDAQAYAAWLGERTGAGYRLPSEAEWEYAAGPGTGTKYHFENDRETLCRYSNPAEPTKLLPNTLFGCGYGAPYPAAVGSYRPNAFGLYDMHGNVWEWAGDCWNRSYAGAPTDGSAWLSGDCGQRIVPSRRLMELPSEAPPWREPLRGQRPVPFHRQRIPRGPNARPVNPYPLTSFF